MFYSTPRPRKSTVAGGLKTRGLLNQATFGAGLEIFFPPIGTNYVCKIRYPRAASDRSRAIGSSLAESIPGLRNARRNNRPLRNDCAAARRFHSDSFDAPPARLPENLSSRWRSAGRPTEFRQPSLSAFSIERDNRRSRLFWALKDRLIRIFPAIRKGKNH